MAPKGNIAGIIARLQGGEGEKEQEKAGVRQLAAPPAVDAEAALLEYAALTAVHEDGLSAAGTPEKADGGSLTARSGASSEHDGFLTARTASPVGSATSRTESSGFLTARTTSTAGTDNRYAAGEREGRERRRKHRRPSMSLSPSLIGSVVSELSSNDDGGATHRSELSDGGLTDRSAASRSSSTAGGHRTHRSAQSGRSTHRSKSRGPGGKRDRSQSAAGHRAGAGAGAGAGGLDFYVVPEQETPKVAAAEKFRQDAQAERRGADLEARLFSSGLTPKMANLRAASPRAAKSPRFANNGFTSITPTNNIFRNAMMMQETIMHPETVRKGFKAVAAASPAATPTGVGCMISMRGVPQSPTTPKVRGCGIRMPFRLTRSSSSSVKLLKK